MNTYFQRSALVILAIGLLTSFANADIICAKKKVRVGKTGTVKLAANLKIFAGDLVEDCPAGYAAIIRTSAPTMTACQESEYGNTFYPSNATPTLTLDCGADDNGLEFYLAAWSFNTDLDGTQPTGYITKVDVIPASAGHPKAVAISSRTIAGYGYLGHTPTIKAICCYPKLN